MSRRRLAGVLRAACYALVLAFLAQQLWEARHDLAVNLQAVGPMRAVCAGLLTVVGAFFGMLGWRVVLAGLGTRLDLASAARVYFVAGLGKYLPGGVWPALGHADLGRAMHQPPARLAGAFLGSVGLSVLAGATVGMLALPRLTLVDPAWWALIPLLTAAALPFAVPRVGRRLSAAVFRRLPRRARLPLFPSRPAVVRAALLMAVGWLVSGAHLAVLVTALGVGSTAETLAAVGGFALASVTGMAAFVLPGGVGAREVTLGLVLTATVLPGSAVVAVVALSRVLVTLADGVTAAVAMAVSVQAARHTASRSPARAVLE